MFGEDVEGNRKGWSREEVDNECVLEEAIELIIERGRGLGRNGTQDGSGLRKGGSGRKVDEMHDDDDDDDDDDDEDDEIEKGSCELSLGVLYEMFDVSDTLRKRVPIRKSSSKKYHELTAEQQVGMKKIMRIIMKKLWKLVLPMDFSTLGSKACEEHGPSNRVLEEVMKGVNVRGSGSEEKGCCEDCCVEAWKRAPPNK